MFVRHSRLMVLVAVLTVCAALPALAGKPVFHGIVSQGYLDSSEYNYLATTEPGTFAFNEMLLNVSAPVSANLRVGAQIISRNLGTAGNDNVVLDWAFGDYRVRDEFGVRLGKVKTPFGFYNQTRDVDMVRNSILLPQSVYTERFRDMLNAFEGVSAYGSLSIGDNASLEYEAFLGTVDLDRVQYGEGILVENGIGGFGQQAYAGALALQAGYAQLGFDLPIANGFAGGTNGYENGLPIVSSSTEVKSVHGMALRFNTPLSGLRVGGSFFRTQFDTDAHFSGPWGAFSPSLKLTLKDWYVLSAEYATEKFVFAGEFSRLWVDFDIDNMLAPVPMVMDENGLPQSMTGGTPTSIAYMAVPVAHTAASDFRGGYYVSGTYQANDWLQLGSYYSVYYPDFNFRDQTAADDHQKDVAVTARFDVTDYWLLKFEAHFLSGTGDVDPMENFDTVSTEDSWTMFGVKSTFFF